MKKSFRLIPVIFLLLHSCNTTREESTIEKWKGEIMETELAFAEMAQNEGIPEAFLTFAAEDVVVLRNDSLIIGKESLRKSYNNNQSNLKNVRLSWKPDFVDVSSSGDLGYTYGKYVYTATDSTGNSNAVEGIFHTVWKRQPDGNWRFVWD